MTTKRMTTKRRGMYRPQMSPEPLEGFRVVTDSPMLDRTWETMHQAERMMDTYHALGVTDARIVEWSEKES